MTTIFAGVGAKGFNGSGWCLRGLKMAVQTSLYQRDTNRLILCVARVIRGFVEVRFGWGFGGVLWLGVSTFLRQRVDQNLSPL